MTEQTNENLLFQFCKRNIQVDQKQIHLSKINT